MIASILFSSPGVYACGQEASHHPTFSFQPLEGRTWPNTAAPQGAKRKKKKVAASQPQA